MPSQGLNTLRRMASRSAMVPEVSLLSVLTGDKFGLLLATFVARLGLAREPAIQPLHKVGLVKAAVKMPGAAVSTLSVPMPGTPPAERSRAVGPRLCVIVVSDAFREFWQHLASDFALGVDVSSSADSVTLRPETAALIVAAGGAEREALQWLEGHPAPAGVPVLVVGTDPGRRTAMQFVTRGVSDYFAFPDDLEIFRNVIASAVNAARGRATPDASAHADAFAAIVGERGTGKELLARAIHEGGPRRGAPFVAVNCSAFPEHLIESELFGHERGSFTDAHAAKPGLFEVADRGTLFLDEIGDLPLSLQAKLLRVLEDKQIRRVGGTKSRTVDVRILAATNEHLTQLVREGRFRDDLYFRLSSVVLKLPPLRERGDDLRRVAQALLERLAREHGLPVPTLTPEVYRQLRAHPWPGNIRELKNALERGLLLSPAGELSADELLPSEPPGQADGPIPFPAPLHQITTAAVRATVKLCGGNRSESARRLLISPRRLRRLLDGRSDVASDLEEEYWTEPSAPLL